MRRFFLHLSTCLGLALSLSASARAHIELTSPQPRYDITGFDSGIKSCPCGLGGSNRTCNVAVDGSDPQRAMDRVSRFEAGSTVTLRFNEYVDHSGRFRVAFDPDGADMADFNQNILADIPDPANTGGQDWEITVTLPNMTCDNCTLQLVQAMHGDTENPVLDPAPISSYYSCVDVQLVAPGTLGSEPAPGPEGDTDPAAGEATEAPAGEASGEAAPGDGSQTAGESAGTPLIPVGDSQPMDSASGSGATPDTSAPVATNMGDMLPGATPGSLGGAIPAPPASIGDPSPSSSSGGCSVARTPAPGVLGLGTLGLLAALGLSRRSARARRPR